jgi:hypothetical protein
VVVKVRSSFHGSLMVVRWLRQQGKCGAPRKQAAPGPAREPL